MNFDLKNELSKIKTDLKNKNYKKQIANMLTASRLLAPFILIPLMYFNKLNIFILFIILFSLTDAFDGYFARKYNAVSEFGKYLDCVVDKVFALSLLIPTIIKTTLSNNNFNLVLIIIILEFVIGFLNIYSFLKKLNPSSTIYGKTKTYFLFILLGVLYLSKIIVINDMFLFLFIFITIIMQLLSVLSYLNQIKKRKSLIFLNNKNDI